MHRSFLLAKFDHFYWIWDARTIWAVGWGLGQNFQKWRIARIGWKSIYYVKKMVAKWTKLSDTFFGNMHPYEYPNFGLLGFLALWTKSWPFFSNLLDYIQSRSKTMHLAPKYVPLWKFCEIWVPRGPPKPKIGFNNHSPVQISLLMKKISFWKGQFFWCLFHLI